MEMYVDACKKNVNPRENIMTSLKSPTISYEISEYEFQTYEICMTSYLHF